MSANQTPVVFRGRTSEYFGIWIVNLLLSIITLGIYSAWAKVRRKKYFYNNTLIDGVGFDYHASPIAILKGRIIAFVLYLVFVFASGIHPAVSIVLSILLFIAIPWIIVRGLKFNARNSSHRGLRFDFDGSYKDAALIFLGFPLLFGSIVGLTIWGFVALTSEWVTALVAPLLVMAALAFYVPFIMQRQQQFMINHHKFGTTKFDMKAKFKEFLMIFVKLFGVLLGISLIIGLISIFAFKNVMDELKEEFKTSTLLINQTAYVQAESTNENQQNLAAQGSVFIKTANTEPINVENEIDTITAQATASDEALTAAEQAELDAIESEPSSSADENLSGEDMLKDLSPEERAEYDKLMKEYEAQAGAYEDDEIDGAEDKPEETFDPLQTLKYGALGSLALFAGVLLYLAVIFSFVAYIKSRVSNLVLNNTHLDHVSFHSNQRMRDLLWIYVSNALVLMFTMGFATPWAQIRLAKYRADHLSLLGETDWDKFVGEKKEAAKATGEEIADFFDVDLSFGF